MKNWPAKIVEGVHMNTQSTLNHTSQAITLLPHSSQNASFSWPPPCTTSTCPRPREAIESLQRQAKGAVRCRLACARSRAVVALAEEGGISPRDVDMASYPLTLLSAAPRVVPVEDLEDLSHGKSPQDALTAQARHATAEAEAALLDSDTTQSANEAVALPDSDTTQSAEVEGDSETDGESTASDDSGPGRAPGYKPLCMFIHGGPSIEAVAAHRKRQLEGVVEAQPKKKKKQQPDP